MMRAGWSRERLISLFDAVLDLKRCLQVAGSDLVIRRGRSKDVLLALAQEVSKVFFPDRRHVVAGVLLLCN